MSKTITIYKAIKMSKEGLEKLSSGRFIEVEFDNGNLMMTPSEILIDAILIGNILPAADKYIKHIKKEYSIVSNYSDGEFAPSTLNDTMGNMRITIAKGLFNELPEDLIDIMIKVDEAIIECVNELYTNTSILAYNNILTLDIESIFEIYSDPEIRAAVDRVKTELTVEAVANVYAVSDRVIKSKFKKNALGLAYITKVAKQKQVQHIVGTRGFVQDLDSKIYKYPVPYGYLEGIKDIVSYIIESKTAAIAIFHSTKTIERSEWFAREAQVKTQSVRKLIYRDCRTTSNLLDVNVTKLNYADFSGCLFKYTLEDKEYSFMNEDVIGKHIHIRHPGSCELENHDEICIRCFGLMGMGIRTNTNIGSYCSVNITESKTQNLLGFKHLSSSAEVSKPVISDVFRNFLSYIEKDSSVKVRGQTIRHKGNRILHIEVPLVNIEALRASTLDDIDTVYIKQLSELTELVFLYIDKDGVEDEPICADVLKKKTSLSFSKHFIKHVIESANHTVGNNNNIRISLEGWVDESATPFLIPETTAENVTGMLTDVVDLITKSKYGKEESGPIEINSAIKRFYSKVGYGDHISLIATMFYSTTISGENPYKLARVDRKRICYKYRDAFGNASFSAIIGYGYLSAYMSSGNLLSDKREDHPLDVMLMPEILNE